MASFDAILQEVMADPVARAAANENRLRRALSSSFDDARRARGLSVRRMATLMGTSVSQVQRLLHRELGGSLTLRTICRALDVLELDLTMHVRPRHPEDAR